VRKLGSQKTVIERFAGASEPVDDFVVKLWDLVCKKIHLLPEATQKKIGLITDKS
jgi:tRNA A37 threonylcarbamoyladenosine dehydratase